MKEPNLLSKPIWVELLYAAEQVTTCWDLLMSPSTSKARAGAVRRLSAAAVDARLDLHAQRRAEARRP